MDHPVQTDFLRWIVLFPLLGAALNGILGARIQERAGKRMVAFIACAPVTLSFLFSLWAFSRLLALPAKERFLIDQFYTWIPLGSFSVDVSFWVDPLSAIMILVVSGIGGLIHFYSIGYMHDDRSLWRYFAYLNLFTFSMLLLVTADNVLLMFVGWEGVGLCSWALIGFWYSDHTNTRAGNKAFIVNRVGDFGFVLGIFLLYWTLSGQGHGGLAFRDIGENAGLLANMELWGIGVATLVTFLLFIGATGKSAQIPLYVWLPDAMQGPTPVSALIHAATMVTAGVYMIARLNELFSAAPATLGIIAAVGAGTAFFAATIAVTQVDIKRVLAYSTVSQLGYMFLAVGVGAYTAGVFHLLTHAFFKACLFLGSGSIIHAMQGEQDMRQMGGLRKVMPATFWTFTIAVLAIAGTPFLAGFFSKDAILWQAWASHNELLWGVGVFVAGLTAFYMFRQFFMVFFGECRADHDVREHLHESPKIMTYPLWILAAGSVVVGYLGLPPFMGVNLLDGWLDPVIHLPHGEHHSVAEELGVMSVSIIAAAAGVALAWFLYYVRTPSRDDSPEAKGFAYRVLFNKYYVDEIYQFLFVGGTLLLARIGAAFDRYIIDNIVDGSAKLTTIVSWFNGLFDRYVVDMLVNAVANVTFAVGNNFRRVQTGNINSYLYVVVGAVVVALIVKLRYWS